ncbi:hypothetical protein IV203_003403 [Nitzschia inconspicua]|uniref:Secreted protein n=1 Tax=Nitzschia inconspicua TaxID=303405 RepID=A0A9K3L217_9STRA|nr:hypothetical protein IV203_003403 [Nitzschia inconspicua]
MSSSTAAMLRAQALRLFFSVLLHTLLAAVKRLANAFCAGKVLESSWARAPSNLSDFCPRPRLTESFC